MKFCRNCGKKMNDNASFCPHCGFNVSKNNSEKQIRDCSFQIQTRVNIKCIFGIVAAFVFCYLCFERLFGPYPTDRPFIPALLLIAWIAMLIICLIKLRYQVYIVKCPYCGKEVDFPVGQDGWDCSACGQRMLLIDNEVKKINKN